MNPVTAISHLYKPVQPAIGASGAPVTYTEMLPDVRLQPFIACYWQLRTVQPLPEPFYYRVVADGCMDVYFDPDRPQESFVMGFCRQFTEFPLPGTFHYVGIRFLPTMFPQLFRINAALLSNRYEYLQAVVPDLATYLTNHFNGQQQLPATSLLLDRYFLQVVTASSFRCDPRLYEAVTIILQKAGMVNIERDLDTGISHRQLRRLFESTIGDTAKTFCRVVRFQHLLRSGPSVQSLRRNKTYFDAGYYDQSHFIKDFRDLYGAAPGQAFRK